jgi:S1-C subfamily serine protease
MAGSLSAGRRRIGALLILLATAPAAASTGLPRERMPQAAMSLVRVYAARAAATSAASAIVIAPGRAVTSCHVLGTARQAAVSRSGEGVRAELLAADRRHDLCLLGNDALRAAPARIAPAASVSVGDAVFAVGYTAGRFAFSEGRIEALYTMDGSHVIRTSAGFAAGASGGGLFDREGRLVGLLTFYRRSPAGSTYFAVPADWIGDLLAQADRPSPPDDRTPPFWSPDTRDPPAFLTAFALETEGKWEELERFARRWLDAEPGSAEARAALSLAGERQAGPKGSGRGGEPR